MLKLATRPGTVKKWVYLDIPADAQHAFPAYDRDGKRKLDKDGKPAFLKRLAQSTGEAELGPAKAVAAKLEAQWRRRIQDARQGIIRQQEDYERTALELYERLRQATSSEEQAAITKEILTRQGDMIAREPVGPGAPPPASDRFKGLATGELVPVDRYVDAYLAIKAGSREAKTLDQARAIIKRLAAKFEYTRDVTRRAVQGYVNALTGEGASPQTIRRLLSQLRTYWRYLQSLEIVADGLTPFDGLQRQNGGKAQRAKARLAYTPKQVSSLIAETRKRDDGQLADVVTILSYSGLRLDELASMKVTDIRQGCFHVKEDGDGKSEAATRIVPIHSAIARLVKRLCSASDDGYLISGLPAGNKYGKRGVSLSDKFGRLKRTMGFDKRYVLHSIRHTVTVMLEHAGVPENVAADILGHEKPRVTYGTYGHGSSLKQKRDAIERLRYPKA